MCIDASSDVQTAASLCSLVFTKAMRVGCWCVADIPSSTTRQTPSSIDTSQPCSLSTVGFCVVEKMYPVGDTLSLSWFASWLASAWLVLPMYTHLCSRSPTCVAWRMCCMFWIIRCCMHVHRKGASLTFTALHVCLDSAAPDPARH